jgi:UDP-N-acetylmuramyl pentapeptide synthase
MHCGSSLQTGSRSLKIAVLDTIHGAGIIAQRMAELGLAAQALEVYHHSPSVAGFDLIVAPVHLWPENPTLMEARRLGKTIITHHQAVGQLADPCCKVFEITGTHSKTSTALLLARILSIRGRVVSHTTRGIELWSGGRSNLIEKGLSITPGNVIKSVEAAKDQSAKALVCEISLGGVGLADYGVFTSFSEDYKIAGGTKWATTAKLQMISLSKIGFMLVANRDAKISANVSFGEGGFMRADRDRIYFGDASLSLELDEELDISVYQTALAGSAAAAYAAGFDGADIASAFEGFDGIEGRMKITYDGCLEIFDNSNSGLKVSDIERALNNVSGRRLGLVVGEEAETVCEGLNIPALVNLLRRRRIEIDFLVLVGNRMKPWAGELRAEMARDLAAGTELALARHGVDRLLLCVKCFR